MMDRRDLVEIVLECRRVVEASEEDWGSRETWGYSTLDLMTFKLPLIPIETIVEALVVAGY